MENSGLFQIESIAKIETPDRNIRILGKVDDKMCCETIEAIRKIEKWDTIRENAIHFTGFPLPPKDPINILIHSQGGCGYAAVVLYEALKNVAFLYLPSL